MPSRDSVRPTMSFAARFALGGDTRSTLETQPLGTARKAEAPSQPGSIPGCRNHMAITRESHGPDYQTSS
jgi:hypothetical protein